MLPVLRLQAIVARELLARVNDEPGKGAFLVYLDYAHIEVRRDLVKRIPLHECLVRQGGVIVSAFIEIEFT